MSVTQERNRAADVDALGHALALIRTLPSKKQERVFKMLELLQQAQDQAEAGEICQAIAEVLAKSIEPSRRGATADLDRDVRREERQRVAAYLIETGKAIRTRRELLGLTQDQLASKSGLPQSHISRLEKGKHVPTRMTIGKLAKALKTTPRKLDLLFD